MSYVSVEEVKASAQGMTVSGSPPASDDLIRNLIERASRMFDRACGVEKEYFESALHPVWESLHDYAVGDIVTPITPNSHAYLVTRAGTSGSTEPTWPTGSGATVISGSVTFTEHGADVLATNKIVYGTGSNYLRLPPYVPGTLNTSITLPTDYTVPEFVELDGYLIRSSSSVIAPGFAYPRETGWLSGVPITISAKWGFEETPADVKQAVIELVINLWRDTDPATAKLVGLEGLILREDIPPRVKSIAKKWQMEGVAFV